MQGLFYCRYFLAVFFATAVFAAATFAAAPKPMFQLGRTRGAPGARRGPIHSTLR
jgi:hypothetical protein